MSPASPPAAPFPGMQLPVVADATGLATVRAFLAARRLATADEPLALERPGAGNMNCVWRARLPGRTFILKQARPWVEKFPTIAAPVERTETEARFYRLAVRDPQLAARLPAILDHDPATHVLVLADLAPAAPLESCYTGSVRLDTAAVDDLAATVSRLHRVAVPAAEAAALRNPAMRALNHAHIFDLPLRAEGPFDSLLDSITPGLAALAREFRADAATVQTVAALGRRYLDHDRPHLLHGDLFLGSLLRSPNGAIMLIDPEFSFGGDPEFDLGVFYAHLILSHHPESLRARWLEGTAAERDPVLIRRYAGTEIMRRLIGVAQLPLAADLAAKRTLLALARELLTR